MGDDEHEQIVDIARIIKHPDYKEKVNEPCIKRRDFDIMILKLDKLLDLNIFTPACLPRPGNDARFNEKVGTAAGWGRLSKFGNRPSEPHEIDLLVKNNCPPAITYPSIMCYLGKGVVWQGKGGCNVSINQLEKLEAAKASCLVCLSLLSLTGSFWVNFY